MMPQALATRFASGAGILRALSLIIGLILPMTSRYHGETFELLRRLQQ